MIYAFNVLRRAYNRFSDNDGQALAGYIAFAALLGLFPFVILLTNAGAMLVGSEQTSAVTQTLFSYAPDHIAQTLEPMLADVLAGASRGLLTFSAVAALWFSSNVFEALRTAFARAYQDYGTQNWVLGRIKSLIFVIVGVATALSLAVLVLFAPAAILVVEQIVPGSIPNPYNEVRLLAGLGVFFVFLMLLHRFLPCHDLSARALLPGVLISTFVWIGAAVGFSMYLGWTTTYASTYGALAGVAITLIFFYISGLVIIFGAEINAVLSRDKV